MSRAPSLLLCQSHAESCMASQTTLVLDCLCHIWFVGLSISSLSGQPERRVALHVQQLSWAWLGYKCCMSVPQGSIMHPLKTSSQRCGCAGARGALVLPAADHCPGLRAPHERGEPRHQAVEHAAGWQPPAAAQDLRLWVLQKHREGQRAQIPRWHPRLHWCAARAIRLAIHISMSLNCVLLSQVCALSYY